MTDLSKTILAKSDQLNADDLAAPMTITVTGVRGTDSSDQPIIINFENDQGKPFKPCKTMRRVLVRAWGPNGQDYVGRSMTVYNDPTVKWGGQPVGGVRISHLSHIDQDMTIPLTVTRGQKKPVTIKRLQVQQQQQVHDPADVVDAITKATNAAIGGTEAFKTWWNSAEGKSMRHLIKDDADEMAKLKQVAAENDGDENSHIETGSTHETP
jgi:hypothetical protein